MQSTPRRTSLPSVPYPTPVSAPRTSLAPTSRFNNEHRRRTDAIERSSSPANGNGSPSARRASPQVSPTGVHQALQTAIDSVEHNTPQAFGNETEPFAGQGSTSAVVKTEPGVDDNVKPSVSPVCGRKRKAGEREVVTLSAEASERVVRAWKAENPGKSLPDELRLKRTVYVKRESYF
ncbi:hypothetical protein HK097_005292, partial [Rhizophlyctis rosea]